MIICALIAVAAGGAVTAWLLDVLLIAYLAAGVSLLCALTLVAVSWRSRRKAVDGEKTDTTQAGPAEGPAPGAPGTDVEAPAVTEPDATAEGVTEYEPSDQEESEVHIVPGRKRFHRVGCRLLDGHEQETVTEIEAREEGFTPCSVCRPVPVVLGGHRAG